MNKLFTVLACVLIPMLGHAAEIPFSPELEGRLNTDRVNYGYNLKHVARAVYDASIYGGVCATDYTLLTMPANAVVTSMNFFFDNRFSVTGGSGTSLTHVYCGTYGSATNGYSFLNGIQLDNGAGDVATNGYGNTGFAYSGPAGLTAGYLGVGSSWVGLSVVPCDVKVRTNGGGHAPGASGTTTVNSGKFELYLEYYLHQ